MTARTHYEAMEREAAAPADGGPAFPLATGQRQIGPHEYEYDVKAGMTLRDYFAAKCAAAMVSTISDDTGYLRLRNLADSHGMGLSEWIASEAYKQANAMIAARAGGAA